MALRLLAILAVLVVLYLAFGLAVQRSLIYPRPPVPAGSVLASYPQIEAIRLGPDEVEAWFLPPHGSAGRAPAVIFTHGNGELIDYWAGELETLAGWGVGALLVEYPGYGRSGGKPSERSIRRAMVAAHDHLVERGDVDPSRVIAYGRSLGGGAACLLAAERPVAGLILESSFVSLRPFARSFGLFGPFVLDPFDNEAVVRSFPGPVLVVHGERDRIIPLWHGERLASIAPSAELFPLPCGHNDCPRPWPRIHQFLQMHGWLGTQSSDPARRTPP